MNPEQVLRWLHEQTHFDIFELEEETAAAISLMQEWGLETVSDLITFQQYLRDER